MSIVQSCVPKIAPSFLNYKQYNLIGGRIYVDVPWYSAA